MKRQIYWIVLIIGGLLAFPMTGHSQGFLKKLKQKAEAAVGNVIGVETPAEEMPNGTASDEEAKSTPPAATDRLPKLRQSAVVWDGEVSPSRASNPRALLAELPPLPTVDEIVNPTEAVRDAYYNRLWAISLRVDELDAQYSCSEEEMLAARDKLYKEMEGIVGLTSEELKRLDDPNTPEAEKARLEEKVKQHLLGGINTEQVAAKAQSKQGRLEEIQKELEVLEKKEQAGTMTEIDRQRAMQLQQEMMAMTQEMMGDLSGLMSIQEKSEELGMKMQADQAKFDNRLKAFSRKLEEIRKNEAGVVKSCDEIAGEYEGQLQTIYTQVWATADADSIHGLYDRADELMKNYRTRAAKIFLKGLQVRLDNAKSLMGEAEKLYAEMADSELIPQCAMGRAPLNVVTECVDILREAYSEFPQPEVLPAKQETFGYLKKEERVMHAESGFAGGFSGGTGNAVLEAAAAEGDIVQEFIAKSRVLVFNESDQCYYEIAGGQRRKLDGYGPFNLSGTVQKEKQTYGEIPLRKGGRKAVYNRDGSLVLHDGTVLYPLYMKRYGDRLEFISTDYDYQTDQMKYVKCLYKL